MTAAEYPPVILRHRHSRTKFTDDADAVPYRGSYDHQPRPYLTNTPVLDVIGRRNGMTHLWLEYRCAYVGCQYVLLERADHAHDLALRTVIRWTARGLLTATDPITAAPAALNFMPNDTTGATS